MSDSALNQVVKGAPSAFQPFLDTPSLTTIQSTKIPVENEAHRITIGFSHTLPSSPSQIYLNLLILEASLRAQYLGLRARRRQHFFVLTLLGLWIVYFSYALFLRPREDGKGVGGSPYWVVDMAEKVALMGGIVTGMLIWGTGQWERGFRWPRRWIGIANRGLRGMNCKIVVLKGPWWVEFLSFAEYLFHFTSFFTNGTTNYRYIKSSVDKRSFKASSRSSKYTLPGPAMIEEDIAPGGNCIKLLLLPKYFSPTFRENWELYRSKYWDRENERRAYLRKEIRRHDGDRARAEGGWIQWAKWKIKSRQRVKSEENRCQYEHSHLHGQGGQARERGKLRLAPHTSKSYDRSSSRSSSRTSTRAYDKDLCLLPDDLGNMRSRRGSISTSANANEKRRKRGSQTSGSLKLSRLTPAGGIKSVTPPSSNDGPSVSKRDSMISLTSTESGFDDKESHFAMA